MNSGLWHDNDLRAEVYGSLYLLFILHFFIRDNEYPLLQGGVESKDALSLQVIFRKRAL